MPQTRSMAFSPCRRSSSDGAYRTDAGRTFGRERMPDVPTSNPEQFYQGAPLLLVPDVSATADFYRTILGFKADPGAEAALMDDARGLARRFDAAREG